MDWLHRAGAWIRAHAILVATGIAAVLGAVVAFLLSRRSPTAPLDAERELGRTEGRVEAIEEQRVELHHEADRLAAEEQRLGQHVVEVERRRDERHEEISRLDAEGIAARFNALGERRARQTPRGRP